MILRDATAADASFVFDVWLDTFRRSRDTGPIPVEMYRRVYTEAITLILRRPGVRVAVAVDEDTQILKGFACARAPDVVVYVAVKPQYQETGVCRNLLRYLGIDLGGRLVCAFWTREWHDKIVNGRGRWRCSKNCDVIKYPPKE